MSPFGFSHFLRDPIPNSFKKEGLINGYTITGGTITNTALKYVRQNSFQPLHGGRYGVPQILVVMTDGQSANPSGTKTEAGIIHATGIKVFCPIFLDQKYLGPVSQSFCKLRTI